MMLTFAMAHMKRVARQLMEAPMPDSMYKVIELIGSSKESWEQAAKSVVEEAGKHLREMRVAEVAEQDLVIENGKVVAYRTKVKVSFKYQGSPA
jgi:flavin-binding protein dodecin